MKHSVLPFTRPSCGTMLSRPNWRYWRKSAPGQKWPYRQKLPMQCPSTLFWKSRGTSMNRHRNSKLALLQVEIGRPMKKGYKKSYAPVIDFAIYLLVLFIAFVRDWYTRYVEVEAASLDGDNDRVVYLRHPYNLPNFNLRKFYLLHILLYGLKQAPLVWYSKLRDILLEGMHYDTVSWRTTVLSSVRQTQIDTCLSSSSILTI